MTDFRKLSRQTLKASVRIIYHDLLEREIERILREELEGGGQAPESPNAGSPASRATSPAAPDPHEYLDLNGRCVHLVPSPIDGGALETWCNRPADDPIHDVPQVTNYDAEAEAKARIAELERELREVRGQALHNEDMRRRAERERDEARLRIGDGHPVAGFREPLWGPYHGENDPLLIAHDRIEELERELEDVRAAKGDAWVRLDDETINKILDRCGLDTDDWVRVRNALADYRDGKLGSADA